MPGSRAFWPVTHCRLQGELYDGSTTRWILGYAFKIAASRAFKKGLKRPSPLCWSLSPTLRFTLPKNFGDIMGNPTAAGETLGTDKKGKISIIKAQVLVEMLDFEPTSLHHRRQGFLYHGVFPLRRGSRNAPA